MLALECRVVVFQVTVGVTERRTVIGYIGSRTFFRVETRSVGDRHETTVSMGVWGNIDAGELMC